MADVSNRDEIERRLARKVGRVMRLVLRGLLELLGSPPRIGNVPESFWTQAGDDLNKELAPFVEEVYRDQARELMLSQPIAVDWALVNENAVSFARQYTFRLVQGINDTSRSALQRAVGAYFERGQTIGDLERSISHIFGPTRAEMIAVTETTRASVEGEKAIVEGLRQQGVEMTAFWVTNNDEIVMRCPICWPRHGKRKGDGWNDDPPAHPRCRCWLNHQFAEVS